MEIKAADVAKLRKLTGAGMMDCKKALQEAEGDFDKATQVIREKGKAIANKRSDREASEGVVIAKSNDDNKKGALIVLNCETDFVAKNEDFVALAEEIVDVAIKEMPASLDELKEKSLGPVTIAEKITESTGVIGEKIELSHYDSVQSEKVVSYIHPGNKIAALVGMNKDVDVTVAKDIAMQVAAMNPVALNEESVPQNVIDQELETGKQQAREEGKPEDLLDKIAHGKLNKFYKESTLINQQFIKENKKSVKQYLQEQDKDLTVTEFKRYSLAG